MADKSIQLELNGDKVYPNPYCVGDLFLTTNSENPNVRYGGTWSLYGQGRCLVCVDTSQSEFNSVKKTGGAKTHTLTVDEMPIHTHTQNSHTHRGRFKGFSGVTPNTGGYFFGRRIVSEDSYDNTADVAGGTIAINNNTGGSQAHNNLPPYITCYIWIRTA